ncbi:hypothetical protein LCL95_05015 [Bacillus timonensis]|nr:hypothetical protein [Bacillus timonensis]
MYNKVKEIYMTMLEDWNMMQKHVGDEGAEWAERFENHFYQFSSELKIALTKKNPVPESIEEIEEIEELKEIFESLPDPLYLNVSIEIEEFLDGLDMKRFD